MNSLQTMFVLDIETGAISNNAVIYSCGVSVFWITEKGYPLLLDELNEYDIDLYESMVQLKTDSNVYVNNLIGNSFGSNIISNVWYFNEAEQARNGSVTSKETVEWHRNLTDSDMYESMNTFDSNAELLCDMYSWMSTVDKMAGGYSKYWAWHSTFDFSRLRQFTETFSNWKPIDDRNIYDIPSMCFPLSANSFSSGKHVHLGGPDSAMEAVSLYRMLKWSYDKFYGEEYE